MTECAPARSHLRWGFAGYSARMATVGSTRVALRAGKNDDFTIYTQERMKKDFAQIANIFGIVLYSIAGISLVVGAIGI